MDFEKIDRPLIRFFSELTHLAGKIGIPSNILINIFLLIQTGAQITQIVFLYYIGKSTITVFIITIPTWLFIWYFRRLIKLSKERPVWIDFARIFAGLYAGIGVFFFFYYWILSSFHFNTFFKEEFTSELTSMIAGVAFMCVLYLLTCSGEIIKTEQQKELPE